MPEAARTIATRIENTLSSRLSSPSDVLVMDDNADVRKLLHQTLTDAGHKVHIASHKLQTISMIQSRKPNLIVLNVMMPKLTDYDMTTMLRNNPHTKNLPIVILSIVYDRNQHKNLGIDHYLSKPLHKDKLLHAIDDVSNDNSPDEHA